MVSRSPGWLRTCYVDEDGLLPLPPKCWDERLMLACPCHSGLWIELRASCMLGVHFASSSAVRQLFLCLLLGMFSNLISYDIFPFLVAPHLTLKPFKLKIHLKKKPSNSQIFHGIFSIFSFSMMKELHFLSWCCSESFYHSDPGMYPCWLSYLCR